MISWVRLAFAFLRRDWQIAASYRTSLVLMAVGGFVTLTVFHFMAQLMGESPVLRQRYGADYFSFALLGVIVATSLRTLQTSFATRVREAQVDGSLETLLASPLSTLRLVSCLAAYPVTSALLRSLAMLAIGLLVFGARLRIDVPAMACVLLAAMLAFGALGVLSAAFVLAFKRGDPFSYALDVTSYLLAGVLYPVEVLPPALQWVSSLLPATHALRGLRAAGLQQAGLGELWPTLLILLAFAALLWPLAALVLALARRHVERAGTLPHF